MQQATLNEKDIFRGAADPRSVCNFMLDEAEGHGPITHLALQKLLYFAHGLYLMETKRPLVSGYFEAWEHGPVHPAAYRAFKDAGRRPINFRATRQNPLTGEKTSLDKLSDTTAMECSRRIILLYGRMTPHHLRMISHAPGAPWRFIVDKARTSVAFGLRIPDNVILERFRYHKVSVGAAPFEGDLGEDTPFA